MSNTSLLLQSITSIGALQPFFRDLLKFISPKSQIFEEIIFSGFPLDSAPFTLSVVSFNSFSPSTAIAISKAIDANSQVAVLTASFNLNKLQSWKLQLNTNYDDFRKRLDKCDKDNNPAFTQIDGFLKEAEVVTKSAPKTWERLSIAARLIFLAVLIPDDTDTVVLNGTDCQSLSDANWKTLNKIISGRSVIFVYNKCPRRLRFGKEGQIAVMNQDTIEIFENRNFTALIKEINAQQISQVATKDRSKDLEYAI